MVINHGATGKTITAYNTTVKVATYFVSTRIENCGKRY